ncbi:MAG: DUF99 family protein [Candidatus Marsarchaeota archaeon]|jgi:endonuclease V-like protein UPF0215 family|nr:DUF99 family protein [Candidatus Marsarchaeota archaeon]
MKATLKKGIRILAIDDARYTKGNGKVLVVGVVGRDETVEGVLSFLVDHDGNDATKKVYASLKKSRFGDQVKLIVINGITLGGLNIVDMQYLAKNTSIPAVGVTRKKPHIELLRKAVMKSERNSDKLTILNNVSKHVKIYKMKGYYVQCFGVSKESLLPFADSIISLLRLAHIIARGVSSGESKGRI